jgi:hypothetical protein
MQKKPTQPQATPFFLHRSKLGARRKKKEETTNMLHADTLGHVCRFLPVADALRLTAANRSLHAMKARLPRRAAAPLCPAEHALDLAQLNALLDPTYVRHGVDQLLTTTTTTGRLYYAWSMRPTPVFTLDDARRLVHCIPHLRVLSVRLDASDVLAPLGELASLTDLRLEVCWTNGYDLADWLTRLGRLHRLRRLDAHFAPDSSLATVGDYAALDAVLPRALDALHDTLESLRVAFEGFADRALSDARDMPRTYAWLASMPRLTALDFMQGAVSAGDLAILARGDVASRLTSFNVDRVHVDAETARLLARFTCLTECRIHDPAIDVDLTCLGKATTPHLHTLRLDACYPRGIVLETRLGASLVHFRALTALHLASLSVTSEALRDAVRHMPHLRTLAIEQCDRLTSTVFLGDVRDTLEHLSLYECSAFPRAEHALVLELHRLRTLHVTSDLFGYMCEFEWQALRVAGKLPPHLHTMTWDYQSIL